MFLPGFHKISYGLLCRLLLMRNYMVLCIPSTEIHKELISFILILCSLWPAFVPVHDPSRNAYIGIQNMGTVFTRRFEADRIGSQVPIKLMHLEGLYELFVSKFVSSLFLSLSLCSNVFSKLCILSRS